MEVVCPIDAQFPQQISLLLEPPSSLQVQEYFDDLITSKQRHGIQVKPTNDHGKGVYVDLDFEEGDLVLKDQMLFGVQHSSNKIDCLVCSFCFRFIGSIELQIGRKLYLQGLGNPKDCFDLASSDGSDKEDQLEFQQCSSTSSRNKFQVPTERVESLMQEKLALPYSMKFPLPSVNICPGGCKEAYYCSKSCAQADWDLCHSLLCTGEESKSLSKKALSRFIEHANETNDIFLLAAKAICCTILKYRKLKAACSKEKEKNSISNGLSNHNFALLLKAWKPISMGYKRRWWDCVALPDDVDTSDETAFRMQIRQLAFESLELLKAAIFDEECSPLFSLEVYGHIIGMFELNNLDLVVASPVEDYFLYIDDLPEAEKKEAGEMTRPFLDALGEDYSVCCQGTAFFPIQSCMNHSCCPSAKAFKRDEDRDGQAAIIACRPITKGEEVTISYIDEDLQLEERQALLADYGFRCKCPRCTQEEAGLVYTKIQ
ncbi:histone-lysine N-methyltransferase ATXR2 [Cynara cardunculus var. scolymus]|uniref:histone-lysine N-methyltransferase ATXR2 n=1 Tax=Cynara cardunculus var. scolymus TaxID=59895 RepID=UPI000D6275E7|nr:histone-lysine N-methyltransferase ATXR2 [Cynara cardunculus var. scolymus]